MRTHGPVVALSLVASILLGSAAAEGQARPDGVGWPASWTPPVQDAVLSADQDARLPVYDDAGELIPLSEIEARVDRSGLKGAFWGTLVGATVGGVIGGLIGRCGGRRGGFQYYCSPREEALGDVLPVGLGLTLGLTGAWIGWEADATTWDEALREIRLRRRVGR